MTSEHALLVILLLLPPLSSSLICNTYGGDVDGLVSGTGTETCLQNKDHCLQSIFWGVGWTLQLDKLSYGMSCDDTFQCAGLPENSCCTKKQPLAGKGKNMVVKCRSENFEKDTMGWDSFPSICETPCEECVNEGDCDWISADPDDQMCVDGLDSQVCASGGRVTPIVLLAAATVGALISVA